MQDQGARNSAQKVEDKKQDKAQDYMIRGASQKCKSKVQDKHSRHCIEQGARQRRCIAYETDNKMRKHMTGCKVYDWLPKHLRYKTYTDIEFKDEKESFNRRCKTYRWT